MIRSILRALIHLATAALGFLLAAFLLERLTLAASGFVVAVLVFTLAQALVSPFVVHQTQKRAAALMSGVGLISTFIALLLASLVPGGLTIAGLGTWILATVIVWFVTAVGGWILPPLLLKKKPSAAPA
ncbi:MULTISPECIES: phage holin family protein [unclassified Pseudactinotalea]|uniref:phage holin family protein n=1 Tax=unclassified Pseudactinotalea TaxID=2649176 RepID=UPI00128B6D73|nr:MULTISPECIES: phage holin family protein [unclassified Pseudactinotalea]MPV49257.1 hypothetical protein [Pseudactinotalea sp. HY160]QGH69445.1 hypothetical protein GCE65_07880 [Pseudactinotalea sp. HY158]